MSCRQLITLKFLKMNKEAQEEYIKSKIDKHNSEISETTEKAVNDAISGVYDPPKSERAENAGWGALVGVLGGPLGIIIGAGIGAATENEDRVEYDKVHEKAKEELKKTN
jgi:hypothetical protein